MKWFLCVLLVGVLLAVAGCAGGIQDGQIVGMKSSPAHNVTETVEVGHIDVGDVRMPIYSTEERHIKAAWSITIAKTVDGKERTATIDVSEAVFGSVKMGDYYGAEQVSP